MKKLIHYTVVMAILSTGCVNTPELQSSMEYRTGELTYKNDSNKLVKKKGGTLAIGSFVVEDVLRPDAEVVETSDFVVPLLLINYWHVKYQANLGYDRIVNDYKKFMKDSFIQEVKQSCRLIYVEQDGDFTAEVTVNKVWISAPITKTGLFSLYGLGGGENFTLGPLDVEVQADVALIHKGAVVRLERIPGKYKTDIEIKSSNWGGPDIETLMQDYTSSMIEGLSLAIKNLNENIVEMINHEAAGISSTEAAH